MKIITFDNVYQSVHLQLMYPVGEHLNLAIGYIDKITPLLEGIIKEANINIWCAGSSGAILSTLLAQKLPGEHVICHVKKPGEDSHHGNNFYAAERSTTNIIIDDFMRTGATMEMIYEKYGKTPHGRSHPIDAIVIVDTYRTPWTLSFVPENLIIGVDSVHDTWKDLQPKL